MSVEGIHWAQKVFGDTMCPFRKALLFALGERHNCDTGLCMPDQEMLARDAGMSARTVRKYAKILEEEGFIERRVTSRGSGLTTHYILNFSVLEAQPVATNRNGGADRVRHSLPFGPTGTPVPVPTGTPVPPPNGSCVPVDNKDSRIYTKKNTNLLSGKKPDKRASSKSKNAKDDTELLKAFDEVWHLWPAKGRERSRSKATVLDQLRRSAASKPIPDLVAAVRAFVAKEDPAYVPGLDRWLRQGRFEHFLPKDLVAQSRQAPAPAPATDGIDWSAMVARYVRNGVWPRHLGDRPDELGYRGPLAPLEAIMANGRVGQLHVEYIRINIDRLRAARAA